METSAAGRQSYCGRCRLGITISGSAARRAWVGALGWRFCSEILFFPAIRRRSQTPTRHRPARRMAEYFTSDVPGSRCHRPSRSAEGSAQAKPVFAGIFEGQILRIQNTVAVNYAGVPALPCPFLCRKSDFPVTSIQLIGPANSEAALLNIGRLIEAPDDHRGVAAR